MSRTITALYDSRTEAEAARARLTAANIDADNVRIMDQGASGSSSSSASSSASGDNSTGIWASLKDVFIPDEDRSTYSEGMRRGGVMLCASVDDDDTDRAIQILDETGSIDLEDRERSWKSEGWAGYTPDTSTTGTTGSAAMSSGAGYGNSDEERIQLAKEELRVGKREVSRGGARVRSYVVETPVSEQVTLREEHVNVERRPVDGTMQSGDVDKSALFQERTIEMTETSEEAVVDKRAQVTEELVVSKTAEERTETVSDTVRETKVDIDNDVNTTGSSSSSYGSNNNKDRDRF